MAWRSELGWTEAWTRQPWLEVGRWRGGDGGIATRGVEVATEINGSCHHPPCVLSAVPEVDSHVSLSSIGKKTSRFFQNFFWFCFAAYAFLFSEIRVTLTVLFILVARIDRIIYSMITRRSSVCGDERDHRGYIMWQHRPPSFQHFRPYIAIKNLAFQKLIGGDHISVSFVLVLLKYGKQQKVYRNWRDVLWPRCFVMSSCNDWLKARLHWHQPPCLQTDCRSVWLCLCVCVSLCLYICVCFAHWCIRVQKHSFTHNTDNNTKGWSWWPLYPSLRHCVDQARHQIRLPSIFAFQKISDSCMSCEDQNPNLIWLQGRQQFI